jgi:hypothetical protein
MSGSEWRIEKNRRSLERLERAVPEIFPKPVLVHALNRPLIPPLPRLAIDSYWRAHPDLDRFGQPRAWPDLPLSASSVPRGRVQAGSRPLLCVRSARVPVRLAHRSLESRPELECRVARRLRCRLAAMD